MQIMFFKINNIQMSFKNADLNISTLTHSGNANTQKTKQGYTGGGSEIACKLKRII
jgi:hypothetical protein